MFNFPADQLTLYIAKKGGEWLKLNDPDVQRLENGEIPHGITALMNDSSKMRPTFYIGDAAFGVSDKDHAGEEEIHVLVDIPQYVKTDPYYQRKSRKNAFWYAVAIFLLMAWTLRDIFISAECLIGQEGRLEKQKVFGCVDGIIRHVLLFVLEAFLAWKWYWK
ncbi:hypothetical protein V7S43_004742 [Phytophthora oleae]|uniref:DDE Tnp4 domain-containing protein n=1 Tax=Phytophthora oleae TaxID=2107226 RepID=A0ABD3FUM0_9STRA